MASLFAHLFDTLPFAALEATMARVYGGSLLNPTSFESPPIGLLSWLTWFPSAPVQPQLGYMPGTPSVAPPLAPIFGYDPAPDAASFGRLWCRVRENDYGKQLVFETVRFGAEGEDGEMKPEVLVRIGDQDLALPLANEFLLQQWHLQDLSLNERESITWPLACIVDWAWVRVFVYDIDLATMAIKPFVPDHDPFDGPDLMAAQEAAKSFQAEVEGIVVALLGEDVGPADIPGLTDTLPTLLKGNFMPTAAEAELMATSPVDKQVSVGTVRVLILASLTVNRERADFEPGAIIGMGRIYPQLIVKASVPLSQVTASVEVVRPSESQTETCHCHEMRTNINIILVSDANGASHLPDTPFFDTPNADSAPFIGPAPLPFWSNLFAYYATDCAGTSTEPYPPPSNRNLKGERLHMVNSSLGTIRESIGQVYRLRPGAQPAYNLESAESAGQISAMNNPGDSARSWTIVKLPRQGEFDNIHCAPTMWWDVNAIADPIVIGNYNPITDRQLLRLDNIVMAPFCAHDCFHMHWRWVDTVAPSSFFTYGWSEAGPYTEPGACMVPLNQDVYFTVTSSHSFVYTAVAAGPIPPGSPQFILHHGMAYGLYASDYKVNLAMRLSQILEDEIFAKQQDQVQGPWYWPQSPLFTTPSHPADSWAAFYWNLRYVAARAKPEPGSDEAMNEWRAVERTVILDFDGVRKL